MSQANTIKQCHKLRMIINKDWKRFIDEHVGQMEDMGDPTDWRVANNLTQAFLDRQKNRLPKIGKLQRQIAK